MQLYQERSQSMVSCQESLFLGCLGRVQEDHLQVDLASQDAAALQLITHLLPCTAWPLAGITPVLLEQGTTVLLGSVAKGQLT